MKILIYNCSNYKKCFQKYSLCGKEKNIYLNSKAAYQHKCQYHKIKNDLYEYTRKMMNYYQIKIKKNILALTSGFSNINSEELKKIGFLSDLHNEHNNYKKFIKHLIIENAKRYLVIVS